MAQCRVDTLGFVEVGEVPLELRGEDGEGYVPVRDWEAAGNAVSEWKSCSLWVVQKYGFEKKK